MKAHFFPLYFFSFSVLSSFLPSLPRLFLSSPRSSHPLLISPLPSFLSCSLKNRVTVMVALAQHAHCPVSTAWGGADVHDLHLLQGPVTEGSWDKGHAGDWTKPAVHSMT